MRCWRSASSGRVAPRVAAAEMFPTLRIVRSGSIVGHTAPATSGLPRTTDIIRLPRHVSTVPQTVYAPQYRLVVLQIEFAGMDRSSLQSSSALRFAAPGHFDGLRSTSMVAMSRSISPQSRISRRLAPGGPASHGRPRNAVSPIRNCQNSRMARDLLRKGRAHDSGPEPRRLQQRHAARLPASRRANQRSL